VRVTEDALDLFQRPETGEPVRVDETLLLRRGDHPRMIAKRAIRRMPRNLAVMRVPGCSDPEIYPHEFLKSRN